MSPYPFLKQMFDDMLAQKQGELGVFSGAQGLSLIDLYISPDQGRSGLRDSR